MGAKLSTTINKVQNLANYSNSKTLIEFLTYMKNNGSSERHQNNILMPPLLKLSGYWVDISALSISSPSIFNFDIISSQSEDCEVKVKDYLVQVGILELSKKEIEADFIQK